MTHPVNAATLTVDGDYTDATPGWGVTAFAKIQDAVDKAVINDTIEVKAGTYTEQVSIAKNLTLVTTEGAVIKAFPGMLADCTSDLLPNNHPIVCVEETSAVTVKGFTIDGWSLGDSVVRLIGIAYRNAGGTVQDNIIQNIRFTTGLVSGDEGVGIYLYNSVVVARTVNILDNTITNFNKNGITVTTHGAWAPITFNIQGNTITGISNATVAQNGIQVYIPRGSGVIQENVISDIAINNSGKPDPLVAVSILNISTPADTLNNVITGAQAGIVYSTDPEDLGNHREISGNQ
ncbi:MAG: right-handed parallel beta-helix repeat-containing protein, partial [Bellilinea sp.]